MVAALDIAFNIFSKAWLIILPINELLDFIDIKVPYQYIVVVLANELYLNDFRYKQ